MAKLSVKELVEAIDTDAANDAVAGIKSRLDSLPFAAPELWPGNIQQIVAHMNALATALQIDKL